MGADQIRQDYEVSHEKVFAGISVFKSSNSVGATNYFLMSGQVDCESG